MLLMVRGVFFWGGGKSVRTDIDFVGELGLGNDEAKSATKPLRINPLVHVNVIECVLCLVCFR